MWKMKINEAENIINEYRNNGIIVGLTKMYYIINNGNERKWHTHSVCYIL